MSLDPDLSCLEIEHYDATIMGSSKWAKVTQLESQTSHDQPEKATRAQNMHGLNCGTSFCTSTASEETVAGATGGIVSCNIEAMLATKSHAVLVLSRSSLYRSARR